MTGSLQLHWEGQKSLGIQLGYSWTFNPHGHQLTCYRRKIHPQHIGEQNHELEIYAFLIITYLLKTFLNTQHHGLQLYYYTRSSIQL